MDSKENIDELAESLALSFSVSSDPNSVAAPHPRFSEYKKKSRSSDQEARRKAILEQQKSRRIDFANHARRLVEDVWDNSDDLADDDEGNEMESMDVADAKVKRSYKPGRYYRNQLMLSEWMVEVPEDFEEEWLMVACPWGKRCLIVSARGATTAYGRNGYRVNSFPSYLPGGNRQQAGRYKDNAILDCIYHEVEKTFYVLDIMNWKDHPVYDSDTEFRVFWMMSKMQEMPEVGQVAKLNPYKFLPLQYHPCKKESLKELFQNTFTPFDGCLFYHKRAHYTFGSSPLVVWLKPFMIPEMLGVEVPVQMHEQKPANYSTYAAHLEQIKERKDKFEKERQEKPANWKSKGRQDRSRHFKMDLMESKWFLEVPDNFEMDWTTVVCPTGQRCLIMAIDGETKWFSKKGFKLPGYFLSVLPGGNPREYGFGRTVVTLLDCIYHEEMLTYFVLDCIMWAGHDLKDLKYTDRVHYLKKEIMKKQDFRIITDINMFKIVPLYHYNCTVEGLDQALRSTTFEVDGILFYKNDSLYHSGETENVKWIKPYMLPDIFPDIAVPKWMMLEKPANYKDFETFKDDVQNGRIKEKKNKKKKANKEFVPNVKINFPPPPPEKVTKGSKKNKKKNAQQQSYFGPEEGFHHHGYGRGMIAGVQDYVGANVVKGHGRAYGDTYSRMLAGMGDASVRPIYGKGNVSGFSYYGDDGDYYYPDYQNPGCGRDNLGTLGMQQDSFRMSEMQSALSYNAYDAGSKKQWARNQMYQMF